MPSIEENIKLDYCDVLIRPKRSTLGSRKDVELIKEYKFRNSGISWHGIPIIASNMDCIGTQAMAKVFANYGMLTALHKYFDIDKLDAYGSACVFITIGFDDDGIEKINHFCGIHYWNERDLKICIDVANAYSEPFVNFCESIRDRFPKAIIVAGNVATPEMVQELLLKGVDIVKIGIGSGSVCTTRLISGVGYPQLSAVLECAEAAHGMGGHICADGGIVYPGDVAKAFGAGADFVMLGGILSGTDECEGEWEEEPEVTWPRDNEGIDFPWATGKRLKKSFKFYGMSSKDAMEKYNGGVSLYRAAEGKSVKVSYKGPVENTIQEILGGLRSACTYAGAWRLKDLPKCTTFVRVNQTHNTIFSER